MKNGEKAVMPCFMILTQHYFHEDTEEKHEAYESEKIVSEPIFEPEISRILRRSVI
jgi:hypothetical protein